MVLFVLASCGGLGPPGGGLDTGDGGADTNPPDTADGRSVRPPVGVFRLTELRRSREDCFPEAVAEGWGPYDRAAVNARYGEEWEFWGWNDPAPGDDECVGGQVNGGLCEPACADGERCTVEGECVAWPEPLDIGAVEVTGGATPVRWEPGVGGTYALWTEVPAELFAADALVLRAEGGSAGAPRPITVMPPARLDLGLRCERLLTTEEDLVVTWTPGEGDARVRVTAREIDHGGGGGAPTYCEGPDDGELRIPGSLLRRAGASRLFEVELSRRTVGAQALGDGELRLEAVSAMRCSAPGPTCQ